MTTDAQHGGRPPGLPEQLFYRLNVIHLVIPPLRAARRFPVCCTTGWLTSNDKVSGCRGCRRAALDALTGHAWPQNMRELRSVASHLARRDGRGIVGSTDVYPHWSAEELLACPPPPRLRHTGLASTVVFPRFPHGHGLRENTDGRSGNVWTRKPRMSRWCLADAQCIVLGNTRRSYYCLSSDAQEHLNSGVLRTQTRSIDVGGLMWLN